MSLMTFLIGWYSVNSFGADVDRVNIQVGHSALKELNKYIDNNFCITGW